MILICFKTIETYSMVELPVMIHLSPLPGYAARLGWSGF
jgi:hypothetical protein